MQVKKFSGELVPFNPANLKHSLSRSGADNDEVIRVFDKVVQHMYDGISTRELYDLAFDCLKTIRESYAARYSLKKALRDLGPEGYYFEKWIARLFQDQGYKAITGQTLQGHAVTHEIDVLAVKEDKLIIAECKFRNDIDAKISVTTPMYYLSRLKDVSDLPFFYFNKTLKVSEGWLITNAYLTTDSIKFGEKYNLIMLSWDYPKDSSLKVRVDNMGEYPITCLTTLTDLEKSTLLKNQCILVKDITQKPDILQVIQINNAKKKRVLMEAQDLVNS